MPEIRDVDHPHPIPVNWFAAMRLQRRERLAAMAPGKGAEKRRAVVTMVHNEPVFLPIWLRYYSRYFAPDDIFVLDNDTTDGSTAGDGFVRIPVSHDRIDHTWMTDRVQELQHELLDRYDVVLAIDVDEIVCPRPERGDLGLYIDELEEDYVNAIGYELVHLADREPPIDLEQPILDQRRHWAANDAYDKPALAMVPMSWVPGFHERADGKQNFDPDLLLIHLHRMDFDLCRKRHLLRSARAWNDLDVERGWAAHNRIVDEESFRQWFYFDSGVPGIEMEIQKMPESWIGRF